MEINAKLSMYEAYRKAGELIFALLTCLVITACATAGNKKSDENGILSFHIVDEEATEVFNNYFRENPDSTFNEQGQLIDPNILPADVTVIGVFSMNKQKLDEDGNPVFVAIKREVGLDGNHVMKVKVEKDIFDPPKSKINISLDAEGGEIFYSLTASNVGKGMALVVDNRVRFIAIIQTAIRDAVSMSGLEKDEANELARMLKNAGRR
jgi:preprotein translocase subunit SecD